MLGIISFGIENIHLLSLLRGCNIRIHTIVDTTLGPRDNQQYPIIHDRIRTHIRTLQSLGCTQIILSPLDELAFADEISVLQLFSQYLHLHCLKYSLVGKLCFLTTRIDETLLPLHIPQILQTYTLTPSQMRTAPFHTDFPYWTICVPARNTMIQEFSRRQMLVNHIVKVDCRKAKDAGVDTIIPCQWSFFAYQRTLSRFFASKKYRFHDDACIREYFLTLFGPGKATQQIYYHGSEYMHDIAPRKHILGRNAGV